jgi:predicted HTH domain antitoxin
MLAAGLYMDRSAVIRSIIDVGVRQKLIEYSLNQFVEKKVFLAKAAEIAGISIREMLDILNEKGIPLHISQKSIMKDFEAAMQ